MRVPDQGELVALPQFANAITAMDTNVDDLTGKIAQFLLGLLPDGSIDCLLVTADIIHLSSHSSQFRRNCGGLHRFYDQTNIFDIAIRSKRKRGIYPFFCEKIHEIERVTPDSDEIFGRNCNLCAGFGYNLECESVGNRLID